MSGNWQGPANLFAAGGSVQNYRAGVPVYAYLAKKTKSKKIAVISYGPGHHLLVRRLQHRRHRPGQGRVQRQLRGRRRPAGRELLLCRPAHAADRDRHGDLLHAGDATTSPWPGPSSSTGCKIKQLWLSGYDQTLLDQYSNLMQGVYFNISGTVPYEAATIVRSTYPGMETYIKEMNKYEPAFTYNGVALQGWQSAALLAAGGQGGRATT